MMKSASSASGAVRDEGIRNSLVGKTMILLCCIERLI